MIKRAFDATLALVGLLTTLPVCATIALTIWIAGDGPVLFRQVRVGRFGRPFEIVKFRTMIGSSTRGPSVTAGADPRVTPLGGFLRRWKLDELPQLWNVLRGDMSLVGPRPEVPEFVELYPREAREIILSVRPGITDEASLRFRNESDFLFGVTDPRRKYVEDVMPKKIECYIEYVHSHSFWGDIGILLRTIFVVLLR